MMETPSIRVYTIKTPSIRVYITMMIKTPSGRTMHIHNKQQ